MTKEELKLLSPSPWYFVSVPPGSELETLVYLGEDDEHHAVLSGDIKNDASTVNWDFIAMARKAFDGDPESVAWWQLNRRIRVSEKPSKKKSASVRCDSCGRFVKELVQDNGRDACCRSCFDDGMVRTRRGGWRQLGVYDG